jgi:hypothetical protein
MMTWQLFRRAYEAAALPAMTNLHAAIWRNVADDLERLADVRYLADVPGALDAFAEALRGEQVDSTSIGIYRQCVGQAMQWATDNGLIGERLAAA